MDPEVIHKESRLGTAKKAYKARKRDIKRAILIKKLLLRPGLFCGLIKALDARSLGYSLQWEKEPRKKNDRSGSEFSRFHDPREKDTRATGQLGCTPFLDCASILE